MGSRARTLCGIAALCVFGLARVPVIAQEVAATVQGRVTGADGRGLSGVTIVAQSADLIRHATTTTNGSGDYALAALPPGPYVIAFSRDGLVPVKRTMRLSATESATLHVTLRPENGFDGAVTVTHERLAFPPSWITSLETHAALQTLPVTGTFRSVLALVTEMTGQRPSESLFVFDGLPLRHGWRVGFDDAFAGPGPEAIQEATVAPGRLPATYGRLLAGTTGLMTTAGGRRLAGSVRTDFGSSGLNADFLRTSRPLDGVGGDVESTLGGAAGDLPLWFFVTGRHVAQSVEDTTAFTDLAFAPRVRDRFGLGRVTYAPAAGHRFEVQAIGASQRLADATPGGAFRVADSRALETRALSDRALSAAYIGRLGSSVLVTARYTREAGEARVTALTAGTDTLSDRTRLIDQETGVTAWASGGCATCDPREARHETLRLTAGSRLPGALGSHYLTVGAETARDAIDPASRPAGGSFELHATRFETTGDTVAPVFVPGGSSWISWFPEADNRLRFRSDAVFLSDRWSASNAITVDLGLRFDRQRATLAADGTQILSERAFSPRIGATWRLSEQLPWTVNAFYGRYIPGLFDRSLDASQAVQPSQRVFVYNGPSINTAGPGTPSPQAIDQVFDWFFASGGTSRTATFAAAPGLSTTASDPVAPPRVDEWSAGLSRELGEDGYARADVSWRTYGNLPGRRVVPGSAPTFDPFGAAIDAGQAIADDRLERRYASLSLTADYRFGHWGNFGGRYTFSSLRGNVDDATLRGGLPASGTLAYPEYFLPSWHLPVGALPDDARHRVRMWVHSELHASEAKGLLVLSMLISGESGRPYGAAGLVDVSSFVANPGYQQAPVAARYYFTGRDAFRAPPITRADIGLSYRRRMPKTVHGELFARFDILNLMDKTRVLNPELLVVTRTAFTDPSLQPFNPFTDTPVLGTHWVFDDANVRTRTANETVATTLGRAFRLTLGIRF